MSRKYEFTLTRTWSIKSIASGDHFEATVTGDIKTTSGNLYNGNITHMVTAIYGKNGSQQLEKRPMGYAYRYDQLHRIKRMYAFQGYGNNFMTNNTWSGISSLSIKYKTTYTYDGNGNIMTLTRNGDLAGSSGLMDDLSYEYEYDGSGKLVSNRLYHVDDARPSTTYTNDYDDPSITFSATNIPTGQTQFVYDQIGNLIKDVGEGIDQIKWNVYGKITEVLMGSGVTKPDLEFRYDATGNRYCKIVKSSSTPADWVYTYYARDAQGNVMATYTRDETGEGVRIKVDEHHLYGSSRLGVKESNGLEVYPSYQYTQPSTYDREGGLRRFELSNHLGNVLTVISDLKVSIDVDGLTGVDYYLAEIISASDYYPFGSLMPGRNHNSGYRYGFNGKEMDNEVSGNGNQYDYGFRVYNPRLGKFLSVDPLTREFPHNSTYAYAENDVVRCIDLEGAEKYFAHDGSLIAEVGNSAEIRILNSEEDIVQFISFQAGLVRTTGNWSLLTEANNSTQSKVLTTIYNKEIGSRNSSESSYELYQNRVFVKGKGLEGYTSDSGNDIGSLLGQKAARSYFSEASGEGIISMNHLSNDYYNMAKGMLHEDIHNKNTKKGIDNNDPAVHFDVEMKAFQAYKRNINERDVHGTEHSQQLLTTYLNAISVELNEMHKNGESGTAKYKERYNQYTERKKEFNEQFNK